MLFNTYLFIFIFLPITLLGYYLIIKLGHHRLSMIWLIAASLLFYGWAQTSYIRLISFSVLFNFAIGTIFLNQLLHNHKRTLLVFGVTINLLLLGYFKYTNFLIDNINTIFNKDFHFHTIILPLAISFFTLQQIAYLIDAYHGKIIKNNFLEYCLFMTFFPKLISGPIIRFGETIPQLAKDIIFKANITGISIGLTVFFIGLFKKVIIADGVAAYSNPIFNVAAEGTATTFFESWIGALSYSLQLYFDFSGYCDMAIGLGLILGIRLPLNFYSPYKATSFIDFWRRWHITLSNFFRDYLYIPLGGNRKGQFRQNINLMIVMLIAGFWHGAGWNFIIWGGLHGFYLIVNHTWRRLRGFTQQNVETKHLWPRALTIVITFLFVTIAWVFFRAENIKTAINMIQGMAGLHGFLLPVSAQNILGPIGVFLGNIGVKFAASPIPLHTATLWIISLLIICWFFPNAQEYMINFQPALDKFDKTTQPLKKGWLRWEPSIRNAFIIACIIVLGILGLNQVSEFLYFKF